MGRWRSACFVRVLPCAVDLEQGDPESAERVELAIRPLAPLVLIHPRDDARQLHP